MRILFCTGSSARYMAPPLLGDEQINCGPDWLDRDIGGHVISLATAVGDYDVAALLSRLPSDQQPDAIVCLVDAAWRSTPRNLKAFRGPKVLLVADTHHLRTPITGMIRYAQSEPFDRVVLLYDRHHWEFFKAAGVRQLFWFPGLTFPHADAAVLAARSVTGRTAQLAFVGQTGICHPRRTQMISHLNAHQLPVVCKATSQKESLAFYGTSLVGFNSSLNGDLNLRVFEIMASGAMLLTDSLAPASGLGEVWQEGRELVSYRSPAEMVERAQQAFARPLEAQAIGNAGARWFDTHFSAAVRVKAFQNLINDGTAPALFPLPKAQTFSVGRPIEPVSGRLVAGFEYVQELHRNLDRVVIALDDSVPEEFAQMCATLPRLETRRGLPGKGHRVDFLTVGRTNFNSPILAQGVHVWPWEGVESDRPALVRRCTSMGLMLAESSHLIFSRQRVNTHTNHGAVALVRLEQGGYDDALNLAHAELAKNPKSIDAHIVLVELAQETGNLAIGQGSFAQLQTLAPHHPRLREIQAVTPELIRDRKPARMLRVARSLIEAKRWGEADKMAREVLAVNRTSAEAYFILGCVLSPEKSGEQALQYLGLATKFAPAVGEYWYELGSVLRRMDRIPDALGAFLAAVALEPQNFEYQLSLGEAAMAAAHGAIAVEALTIALALRPAHVAAARWLGRAQILVEQCDYAKPRNLLISHVEVTRLQGTGVLLERFFPDSSDFITVRSRTLYNGKVNFSGVHFSLDLPGLSEATRHHVLSRLLAPYRINRILAVPFFPADYLHALAAQELTGAPLATYVMDDQVLHSREVPQALAQKVFDVSRLRLAISPEMVAEYSAWFQCSFDLLPPIVTTNANERPNNWNEARRPLHHCAMVGNIWSASQFEQLRAFIKAAALRVDWFGNANVAWLPQDKIALQRDGLTCQGFLPEEELAQRLSGYPFVVLPSGRLDGSEDNEWLTRLSLPSRLVFILTKTLTPMLVLGSPKTAAASFVNKFGLGVTSNYEPDEADAKIAELTAPAQRAMILQNAQQVAPGFLLPEAGAWIWRSLTAQRAEPTPFDSLYAAAGHALRAAHDATVPNVPVLSVEVISSESSATPSFEHQLAAIFPKLGDHAFLDSFLPADEPRQRIGADVRGGVRFLHESLAGFGALPVRLLAIEQLARLAPQNRAVLVTWAELLEQSGDLKEAAGKARRALSFFYDDVYTQTLFVRCVGDKNYHADASDRFCAVPFENFEIYKDGSVFPCNCTQVPFPIGNAHTQDAKEIWQSPQAQAIRASILDGSFKYCSPMTCWKRFNLPKRSEHPEQFERLQKIGVEGSSMPKHLNLSYDLSCNLSCPSCRNGKVMATAEERTKLDRVRDHIVLPLLEDKNAETVYITGSGDAFGSPHFRGILKQLCDPKFEHVHITLGTNGQLITPRLWEEFKPLHKQFGDITISIDGATPESYERLRRGSTWEKLQLSMGILANARRTGAISRFMVNMVVQQDNFLEMRPLLLLCQAWAVDGVRFYRIRQWGNVVPGVFMSTDVSNPMHPRHGELLEELRHPIFGEAVVDHYDMYELIQRAQLEAHSVAETISSAAPFPAEPALVS